MWSWEHSSQKAVHWELGFSMTGGGLSSVLCYWDFLGQFTMRQTTPSEWLRRRPRREEQEGIQSPWHNKRSDPLTSATLRREGTGQVQPMLRGRELSQGMSTWVGFLEAISEAATQWLCPWEEWVEASSRNLAICIGSSRDTLGWRYRFGA